MSRGTIGMWIVVVMYVACLFTLSSLPGKAFQDMPNIEGLDKVVHGGLYAGLGFLLASRVPAPVAMILCAGVGGAEENYQRKTPGRDCSIYDWMADILGAALGISLYKTIKPRKR